MLPRIENTAKHRKPQPYPHPRACDRPQRHGRSIHPRIASHTVVTHAALPLIHDPDYTAPPSVCSAQERSDHTHTYTRKRTTETDRLQRWRCKNGEWWAANWSVVPSLPVAFPVLNRNATRPRPHWHDIGAGSFGQLAAVVGSGSCGERVLVPRSYYSMIEERITVL